MLKEAVITGAVGVGLFGAYKWYTQDPPVVPCEKANGRLPYAVVTGCSPCSIGFRAAQLLASAEGERHKVILACRDPVKAKQAEQKIKQADPHAEIVCMTLDLASTASVDRFVAELRELDGGAVREHGLALLVNNAGVGWGKNTPYCTTQQGFEEIVGVNHLGHFLLTTRLVPELKRAERSHVVVVSSSLHDAGTPLLPTAAEGQDALKNALFPTAADFDGQLAYKRSKLCNLLFAYELQRRLEQQADEEMRECTVAVNSVTPGFIPNTGLTRRAGTLGRLFLQLMHALRYVGLGFTRTIEEGARSIVATSELADGGGYYRLEKGGSASQLEVLKSSDESLVEAKAQLLWKLSEELLGMEEGQAMVAGQRQEQAGGLGDSYHVVEPVNDSVAQ